MVNVYPIDLTTFGIKAVFDVRAMEMASVEAELVVGAWDNTATKNAQIKVYASNDGRTIAAAAIATLTGAARRSADLDVKGCDWLICEIAAAEMQTTDALIELRLSATNLFAQRPTPAPTTTRSQGAGNVAMIGGFGGGVGGPSGGGL